MAQQEEAMQIFYSNEHISFELALKFLRTFHKFVEAH
jgi:hypothetical protein